MFKYEEKTTYLIRPLSKQGLYVLTLGFLSVLLLTISKIISYAEKTVSLQHTYIFSGCIT